MSNANTTPAATSKKIASMLDKVRAMAKWPHMHGKATERHVIGGREFLVSYCAPTGVYDVGTEARSLALGKRSVAVKALEELFAAA